LTDITTAAIDHLYDRRDKNGFFLMVEGGKIDYACHANDAATTLREVIDFDNAIDVAYKFYKKHPKETLIIITADHETGAFTLGNGSYAINFAALEAQKVSQAGFSRIINKMRHDSKDKVTWKQMQKALKENFGFWDTVQLRERDEQALYSEYERSFTGEQNVKMAESLYYRDEPIAALAVRILNRIAMVSWPVGSHTAAYVPVFAIGNGAEQFTGQMDNTDIPKKIAKIANYK
jgi:alkaline phosphatase